MLRIADSLLGPDGRIDQPAWRKANQERTVVGRCSSPCLGPVVTDTGTSAHGRRWYGARCTVCRHEYAIPEHRIVRTPTSPSLRAITPDEVFQDAGRERDAAILGER